MSDLPSVDQATLKSSTEMRLKAYKSCYEECHFQKRTLTFQTINHTVYECLHYCAVKYQKSYELVAKNLQEYINKDSLKNNMDAQIFDQKAE